MFVGPKKTNLISCTHDMHKKIVKKKTFAEVHKLKDSLQRKIFHPPLQENNCLSLNSPMGKLSSDSILLLLLYITFPAHFSIFIEV